MSDFMNDFIPRIETARLRLRGVVPEDARTIPALMTSNVSQWLAAWPAPFDEEMAASRIDEERQLARLGQAMPYAVLGKTDGNLRGWISARRLPDDSGRASIGYWLGTAFHGQGLMKECLPVVMRMVFEWLRVDVIEAGSQPANTGSVALMKACGMSFSANRLVFAQARRRHEICAFYEINRQSS